MSYKNLSEEAREGLSRGSEPLRKRNLKLDYPIFLAKTFFTWVPGNLDLIIYGMVIVLAAIGVFGVYFDWLKL